MKNDKDSGHRAQDSRPGVIINFENIDFTIKLP
jgi:hypothetical protein